GLRKEKALGGGVIRLFVNGMIQKKMPPAELGQAVASGKVSLLKLPMASNAQIQEKAHELCDRAVKNLISQRENRDLLRKEVRDPFSIYGRNGPLLYVIVATGNIHEDAVQGRAAAHAGADAIAVIRSTAQSLLDYVPHGATTEGFGGT